MLMKIVFVLLVALFVGALAQEFKRGLGYERTFLQKNWEKDENIEKEAEITLEANPDDIDINYVEALKRIGINRVSLGTQTFSPELLRILRRRHTAEQAKEAVMTCILFPQWK